MGKITLDALYSRILKRLTNTLGKYRQEGQGWNNFNNNVCLTRINLSKSGLFDQLNYRFDKGKYKFSVFHTHTQPSCHLSQN